MHHSPLGADAGHRSDRDRRAYHGVNALVLGANGFIGRWVTRALAHRGARVSAVVRTSASAEAARRWWNGAVDVLTCDVSDFDALESVVTAVHPQITFNLIGYGVAAGERDADLAQRLNADHVVALANALAESRDTNWSGPALINAGSSAEYGQTDGPVSGDGPANPITDYGRTKLAGSLALAQVSRERDLPAATARLFMIYGAGEHAHRLFPSLLRAARTGEPLPLSEGRQRLDFTYVEDVAEGLLRLGISAPLPGEIVNLATGRLTQVRTFIQTAAEFLGLPPEQLRFGEAPARPDDVRYGPVRTSRFHQITGWTATTSISEGIRRTVDFLAANEDDNERDA